LALVHLDGPGMYSDWTHMWSYGLCHLHTSARF